jgi:hypothetical protein
LASSLIILEGPKYSGKTFLREKLQKLDFKTLYVDHSGVSGASDFWKDRNSDEETVAFMLGTYVMMAENWRLNCNLVSDRNFLSVCFYHKRKIEGLYFDLWMNAIQKWDQKRVYVLDSPDHEEESRRINKRNNCEDSMYNYYYRQEEKHFFSDLKSKFINNPLFYFGSSQDSWMDITKMLGVE